MRKFLLSLVALSAFVISVSAQTVISFEASEGFTAGDITGQKANINTFRNTTVSTPNTAVVTAERASSGTNSLKLLNNFGGQNSGIFIYDFPSYSKTSVSYDVYAPQLNGSNALFIAFTPSGQLVNINFTYQGEIRIADLILGVYQTVGTYNAGTWYNVRVEIDFSVREINYYINNQLVMTGPAVGSGTTLDEIDFRIDNFGTDAYFDNLQVKDAALAVAETAAEKAFRVYPNPTADVVNFELNAKIISTAVYDAAGKLVKTMDGDVKSIDLATLTEGIYLVKVKTAREILTKKVIRK